MATQCICTIDTVCTDQIYEQTKANQNSKKSIDEYDDAACIVFIVGGITLTLAGSVVWSYASWRFYRSDKK